MLPGPQSAEVARQTAKMAARSVHLVKQLFAVGDGELVSLEPLSDRVRRGRSAAVGKKASDGNFVGSTTRAWGSVLLRPCVIDSDGKHRGKGDRRKPRADRPSLRISEERTHRASLRVRFSS